MAWSRLSKEYKQNVFSWIRQAAEEPTLPSSPDPSQLHVFLDLLVGLDENDVVRILLNSLTAYAHLARSKGAAAGVVDVLTDESVPWPKRFNRHLNVFENMVAALIRKRAYNRRSLAGLTPWSRGANELSQKIAAHATSFLYWDAVSFIAELSGAWILSCPGELIRHDNYPITDDDDYTYCLMTLLIADGTSWMR